MKNWQSILLGIILGILFSGVIILVGQPPRGQPLVLHTLPVAKQITLHISGEVRSPGVYELPRESRLQDAIRVAGGLLENANLDVVNLAAPIVDGEKIVIPPKNQVTPQTSSRSSDLSITPAASSSQPVTYQININSAPLSELETLPGIGPTKAQQIILYRQEHGPFKTIEELQNVPGIGAITFERLKELIIVSATP